MTTVLVTGCSSGFGDKIARTLASHGYHVYASMRDVRHRNSSKARQLSDWAATSQYLLHVVELDVTNDASVESAVGNVIAAEGQIDVVVNNAGVSAAGPLEAFSAAQMASLLDINVLGAMRVNQAVLPTMRARNSGLIIWITSGLGRVLPNFGGLYAATKWAAEGFAESLHYEVRRFGVDVSILEPGAFPTPAVSKSIVPDRKTIARDYISSAPARPERKADSAYQLPDTQLIADAVQHLVELRHGQRPLRTVVGPIFTEGIAEYNETYERVKAQLAQSLGRPGPGHTLGLRDSQHRLVASNCGTSRPTRTTRRTLRPASTSELLDARAEMSCTRRLTAFMSI